MKNTLKRSKLRVSREIRFEKHGSEKEVTSRSQVPTRHHAIMRSPRIASKLLYGFEREPAPRLGATVDEAVPLPQAAMVANFSSISAHRADQYIENDEHRIENRTNDTLYQHMYATSIIVTMQAGPLFHP